jgi:2-polyprenyl-3-methyl-5-hydroxy-6-metoxy-1,4-benzoquinol methylase
MKPATTSHLNPILNKAVNTMLKDTGERVIPEKMDITNELLIEHLARYHFATHYAKGRVLDFTSGSGYGSHILAKKGKDKISEIIGVDNDKDAVTYAKATYYHPLTTFTLGDVKDSTLPDKLGTFDTIVSFETYEHIAEEKAFLTNLRELLKPGGTLIISTPFGKGRGIPSGSPFHVHQITVDEFKNLFPKDVYSNVDYFFQKGALIVPESFREEEYYPLGIAICKG